MRILDLSMVPRTATLTAGAGHELYLVDPQVRLPSRDECGDDRPLIRLRAEQRGRLLARVLVAPLTQSRQGKVKVTALVREQIFVSIRALLVEDAPKAPAGSRKLTQPAAGGRAPLTTARPRATRPRSDRPASLRGRES